MSNFNRPTCFNQIEGLLIVNEQGQTLWLTLNEDEHNATLHFSEAKGSKTYDVFPTPANYTRFPTTCPRETVNILKKQPHSNSI